jgi:hypothetical protein
MSTLEISVPREPVGMGTAFAQQMKLLWLSRRWLYLVVLMLTVLLFLGSIRSMREDGIYLLAAAVFLLATGMFWAMAVWNNEAPSQRTYHWSLPAARTAQDTARILAGALYLFGAYALMALVYVLLTRISGPRDILSHIEPAAWANYFVAPLILYFCTMPLVQWRESALVRWTMIGAFVLGLANAAVSIAGHDVLTRYLEAFFMSPHWGFGPALFDAMMINLIGVSGPHGTTDTTLWYGAAGLWLTVGVLLTGLSTRWRAEDVAAVRA